MRALASIVPNQEGLSMLYVKEASAACRATLHSALERRLLRSPQGSRALGWGMTVGQPMTKLTWPLETLPAEVAQVVEQWFALEGGASLGLAVMTAPRNTDVWSFAGVRTGLLVQRLRRACQLAQEVLGRRAERYQVLVVDVPALQFAALWLSADAEDLYIALLDTDDLSLNKNLEQEVRARMEVRAAAEANQQ